MLRVAVIMLGLGLLTPSARAETEPVLRITGFGVIAATEVGDRDQATIMGNEPVRTVDDVRLLKRTDRIRARLCLRFGVLFEAESLAAGERVEVMIRSTHPGLLSPDGTQSTGITYPSAVEGGRPGYVGYTFDQAWELVSGPWTFAVMYQGRVLVEQRFDVVIPSDGGRPLPGACNVPIS
jgi:hypothetical protein